MLRIICNHCYLDVPVLPLPVLWGLAETVLVMESSPSCVARVAALEVSSCVASFGSESSWFASLNVTSSCSASMCSDSFSSDPLTGLCSGVSGRGARLAVWNGREKEFFPGEDILMVREKVDARKYLNNYTSARMQKFLIDRR